MIPISNQPNSELELPVTSQRVEIPPEPTQVNFVPPPEDDNLDLQ